MAGTETEARVQLRVSDMDCPSCVRKIEDRLRGVEGVIEVTGSPVSRVLEVDFDDGRVSAETLRDEVGRLGYAAHRLDGREALTVTDTWTSTKAKLTYGAVALFVGALVLLALGWTEGGPSVGPISLSWPQLLFVGAAFVGGLNFFGKGIRSALLLTLDMNFLMTIAILGAIGIGEYLEAGAIAFLFSIAELLETYSIDRARAAVGSLVRLAPDTARVVRGGEEVVVPAEDVRVGDLLVLLPGDRAAADGRVVEGISELDQSALTGESIPVPVEVGDQVLAGAINREGYLRVEVDRPADQSTLARIIDLVEEAQASRTRSERFVDTFARYYTPFVTVSAALVAFGPPLVAGAEFETWFLRGLTLLVIACPCALVISTPVAVVSGVTSAARRGVLIKGGTFLEASGRVGAFAFDKTGTLTHGHPEVDEVLPVDGIAADDLIRVAAAVESRSEHPIGASIRAAAREREIEPGSWRIDNFRALPGRGAIATLDGVEYRVGRPELFAGGDERPAGTPRTPDDGLADGGGSRPMPPPILDDVVAAGGRTVIGVGSSDRFLGWITLGDRARAESVSALQALRDAGVEHLAMLTGDNAATAERVAAQLGMDDVLAGLLPEQKVDAVTGLERRYGSVAMVGDGVNDAPALAAATVGIAMGAAGSSTALETADIALMSDDLNALAYLVRLSKRANRIIRQNVALAIAVKLILVVGVPLGWVSLVLAVVVGDLGVSLAVILNALRLGRLEA